MSGSPRFVNVLHADVIGEGRFLPKYQAAPFSRAEPDLERHGAGCNLGVFGIADSYHDPTGAGVIRDRRPRREGNDRRARRQIRLQLLRPWR